MFNNIPYENVERRQDILKNILGSVKNNFTIGHRSGVIMGIILSLGKIFMLITILLF